MASDKTELQNKKTSRDFFIKILTLICMLLFVYYYVIIIKYYIDFKNK